MNEQNILKEIISNGVTLSTITLTIYLTYFLHLVYQKSSAALVTDLFYSFVGK